MLLALRAGFWISLIVLLTSSPLLAQPGKHEDPLSWDRNVAGLVRTYCYGCHNDDKAKGNVNLQQDTNPRLILGHRDTWKTAQELLEASTMPPEKAKQPTDVERKQMIDFLAHTLDAMDCSAIQDPGPPPFRRLNHVEYNNTILDLTGLDLQPADAFSPDPNSFGYDCIGEALTLAPAQVEQYRGAARKITEALLAEARQGKGSASAFVWDVSPEAATSPRQSAQEIISRFATRAFRRPVETEYLEKLMAIYDLGIGRGDAQERAIGAVLTAIMISPRFLIRLETVRPEKADPYPVDDYELASRLSYFVWSRPPDETLLTLAAEGRLNDPQTLEQQTRRMLTDPRGVALAENFFGQWLELRGLADHEPDQKTFPEYNRKLRDAMGEEVRQFLAEIVRENRPIRELIDADYTYLNKPLADWYGIPGVEGEAFGRVALTDRRRGGLLTTAAVLMLRSDANRTNIPRRGNYVAGRILGDAPPPPPPDVPALPEEKGETTKLTLRERLEMHRKNSECASCHSRIDPLGFSLENYDALGRWREQDAGLAIDPSGQLPDGRKLAGPVELKDVLLSKQKAFSRTLVQNLLIYALGRGLQVEDECVIRDALAVAEQKEGRFGELVVAIVQSTPFRYRRNADF
jgi:hypothetical protein